MAENDSLSSSLASCRICLPLLRVIRFLGGTRLHFPTLLAVTLVHIFVKTHAMDAHEIMLIKALTTVFYFMLHSFLTLCSLMGMLCHQPTQEGLEIQFTGPVPAQHAQVLGSIHSMTNIGRGWGHHNLKVE